MASPFGYPVPSTVGKQFWSERYGSDSDQHLIKKEKKKSKQCYWQESYLDFFSVLLGSRPPVLKVLSFFSPLLKISVGFEPTSQPRTNSNYKFHNSPRLEPLSQLRIPERVKKYLGGRSASPGGGSPTIRITSPSEAKLY